MNIPGQSYTYRRQNSLSGVPGKKNYRIRVKRENVRGDLPAWVVSNCLHSNIKEGDVVHIAPPSGNFVLHAKTDRPVLQKTGMGSSFRTLFLLFQ